MADARVIYTYTTDLNITEELLPFVRVSTLVKSSDCEFHVVGLDYVPHEFTPESSTPEYEVFKVCVSFKRISAENTTERYRVYIDIGVYTSADISDDYGEPVYFTFLVSFKNLRGQYELKTIKY
jgi:hypothetical protein